MAGTSYAFLTYDPFEHSKAVFELWDRALGSAYPISQRVFLQNVHGNPYYEPGDAVLISRKGAVVGFGLAKVARVTPPPEAGSLAVVLVDPEHRRQGLARSLVSRLAERLRSCGMKRMGAGSPGLYRFWPGVPTDLEGACRFFHALGFQLTRGTVDLVCDLADFTIPARAHRTIRENGLEIGPARSEEIGSILTFQQAHFPFWLDNYRIIVGHAAEKEIVVARKGSDIVGALCTYSPESRFRAANLVWERLLGERLGGFGSVGVAEAWRGRGVGLALCAAAMDLLKKQGVRQAHVDWTGHRDFYGKLGFRVWREYWMGALPLQTP